MNIFKLQSDFLKAGDSEHPSRDVGLNELAKDLVQEEFDEWSNESFYTTWGNLNDLKEMCDLIYVCAQYMNTMVGADKATKLFEAIHNNNMDKCIDGKLSKREDGKILKPPGFNKEGWVEPFQDILYKTTEVGG